MISPSEKKCKDEKEKERKWKRKLWDSLLAETFLPRVAKGFTLIAASGVRGGEKKGSCNL